MQGLLYALPVTTPSWVSVLPTENKHASQERKFYACFPFRAISENLKLRTRTKANHIYYLNYFIRSSVLHVLHTLLHVKFTKK